MNANIIIITQHAPSTKTEGDYLNGWIFLNGYIHKNLTQNGETQTYTTAGNAEESTENATVSFFISSSVHFCPQAKLRCGICDSHSWVVEDHW